MLRYVAFLLVAGGAIGFGWGWWGFYSVEGKRKYDEMDALWPFLGMAVGGLFAAIGVGLLIWKMTRPEVGKSLPL